MCSLLPHHAFPAFLFFFNDTATTEIYTLSLHDALPICQITGSAAEGVHELAGLEFSKKRRMPGKNAEITFAARDCHPDYLFVDHLAVRRHDLQVNFGGKNLLHKSADRKSVV